MKPLLLLIASACHAQTEPTVELGYRWRPELRGSQDSYRNIVNMGEGPKLVYFESPFELGANKFRFTARDWGGDPFSAARLEASRENWYKAAFDYRELSYFGSAGAALAPSFDTRRRWANLDLDLLPGRRIQPFFSYSHDSGSGHGVTSFVTATDEFPVSMAIRDRTEHFRAGARIGFKSAQLTLEQGGTIFREEDGGLASGPNYGRREAPYNGQRLVLNGLDQAFTADGHTIYERVAGQANPWSWLDVAGQYTHAQQMMNATDNYAARGLFYTPPTLAFQTALTGIALTETKQPRNAASFRVEARPFAKLRLIESWLTDRLNTAPGVMTWNFTDQQLLAILDVTKRVTLRGGQRSVWGDARLRPPQLGGPDTGMLRRQAALAGFTVKPIQAIRWDTDYEGTYSADRNVVRTTPTDYQKVRSKARYQIAPPLEVSASFSSIDNTTRDYKFHNRVVSFDAVWHPGGGKAWSVVGGYTHQNYASGIDYYIPQILEKARAEYRERGHSVHAFAEWNGKRCQFAVGGVSLTSDGSRPLHLYQPVARVSVPTGKRLSWHAEWRWHELSDRALGPDSFGAHLVRVSARWSPPPRAAK